MGKEKAVIVPEGEKLVFDKIHTLVCAIK